MISLKRTPEADDAPMSAIPEDKGGYGYGTCISLEEEHVTALGIAGLQAGTRVRIVAFGVVERVSVDVGEKEPGVNMSIQLTDMEATRASGENAANKLYPGA